MEQQKTNQEKNDSWISSLHTIQKFKKYSQANEEGYVKHIFDNIGLTNKFLVDIGASDGTWLSNSKYFLEELGFTGILMDGDNKGKDEIVHKEWLTAENICELLEKYKCPKEFDYLTFDIDSNDIYVLEKILEKYSPRIIVSEYNPIWNKEQNRTIVYNPEQVWNNDTYYGYSFGAGKVLAEKFGYKIIFQNDDLNLYYVRKDCLQEPEAEININYTEGMLYHKPCPEEKVWVEYK